MESGANADGLMLTPSDKDVGQGFVSGSEDNEVFNDESWESVYLADVLIDSGYDDANPDTFVSTWYSLDCPLDPCLFDNVEEKYSNETTSLSLSGAGVCTAVLLVYVALMFGLLSKLGSSNQRGSSSTCRVMLMICGCCWECRIEADV
ncbi:hypothetical protein ACSBR1_003077 [Camellia fascicularis]